MSDSSYKFCSARVILVKENKILLELRGSCSYASNQWMIPGGHTEHSETAIDSATREMQEELNIVIAKKDLNFFSVLHWWNEKRRQSGMILYWSAENWLGEISRVDKKKCVELRWFSKEEIQNVDMETTSRKTANAFFAGRRGIYLEADWPEPEEPYDSEYDCE